MRVCCISDLHGNLINIEPCELVLICGDISPLNYQRSTPLMEDWLKNEFADWVNSLPCEQVIFIAGNHDFVFAGKPVNWIFESICVPTYCKAIYLENSYYEYLDNDGNRYKIYGTPACRIFGNWAFMYSDDTLKEMYSKIPKKCNILLTHDTPNIEGWTYGKHCPAGNAVLTEAILEKKPKHVFCGHLHDTTKEMAKLGNSKVRNVSILNDNYNVVYEPYYLDI